MFVQSHTEVVLCRPPERELAERLPLRTPERELAREGVGVRNKEPVGGLDTEKYLKRVIAPAPVVVTKGCERLSTQFECL